MLPKVAMLPKGEAVVKFLFRFNMLHLVKFELAIGLVIGNPNSVDALLACWLHFSALALW